ncbi:autophagy protein 5 isoform X2 [Parasteatoda tepidariorum]|uniref:autophagy protein 5 isoform X2 n=1 Tax=Parasteatoda tepidariorum TaxID=114398 RepID=UPI00077FB26F|nr:autophagy protein 5 isoform X2 [Parasteatoda tepidariorum]
MYKCFLMVPRLTYFPLVTDKVQKHFSNHVKDETVGAEMWIDYDSQPLKWNYPVGLLFDFYGADAQLPWNVTVHFQGFPEDELIHCTNKLAVQSHFMSTVKEASSLKHKAQVVQSMLPKEHKELWQGFEKDKFDQFWGVNKRLMENQGELYFKHIPFRLYQPGESLIQTLVKPVHETGEVVTLKDLLETIVPEKVQEIGANYQLITHGIHPPLDMSLQWMSEHMSYADNFLHIVLLPKD